MEFENSDFEDAYKEFIGEVMEELEDREYFENSSEERSDFAEEIRLQIYAQSLGIEI